MAARSASEADRDPASDRDRGDLDEPAVETPQGGDRSAGGPLYGLHRIPLRWRRPEGMADSASRPRDPHVAGFAVGEQANSGLALDAWGAAERALTRCRDISGAPSLLRRRPAHLAITQDFYHEG